MYLKQLELVGFRNYHHQKVEFAASKTILLGDNAQGKSNLLEAVELLSTLKSHRCSRDRDLVLHTNTEAKILATLQRKYNTHELSITLRTQGRRTVSLNQEILRRQLEFLGVLNSVCFSSLDLELVRGAPEYRRDWVDTLLIQLEPIYSHILHEYTHILRQRNALLKAIGKAQENNQPIDSSQLSLWDEQLAITGSRVTRRRGRILQRLAPLAQQWHSNISAKSEVLDLQYTPNVTYSHDTPEVVKQAFLEKLQQRRIPELNLGTTVVGPHRDDVQFTINQTPAKTYGSQGQQRTLVLALKLAQLQLIEDIVGEAPLLLLDDVLAELDLQRQHHLLDTIENRYQTLITTTHLNSFDAQWLKQSQILTVHNGTIL